MSDTTFDFNVFIRESQDVLVKPGSYFSTMRTSGGIAEPLIKAVIYGVVAGIFGLLWGLLHLSAATGGMFGSAVGFMALVGSIIGAVIGLFIGAVIVLVLSSIARGNTDYEACLRVTASIMVIMPINAFLSIISGLNLYLGLIIQLGVNILGIWLLYNGLVEALKAKKDTSKVIMYVLIILMVIFALAGFGGTKRLNQFYSNPGMSQQFQNIEKK